MNTPSDYWEHQQRQKMQQTQAPAADESHLPPHMRGGNQVVLPPNMTPAPSTQLAAPPAIPQLAALTPQQPTVPPRSPLDLTTDPRALQAAFLRGELDTHR